jgi:hypothetical protein
MAFRLKLNYLEQATSYNTHLLTPSELDEKTCVEQSAVLMLETN